MCIIADDLYDHLVTRFKGHQEVAYWCFQGFRLLYESHLAWFLQAVMDINSLGNNYFFP